MDVHAIAALTGQGADAYGDITRPAAAIWMRRCRCPSSCPPIFWRAGPTFWRRRRGSSAAVQGPRGRPCRFLSQHQSGGAGRFPGHRPFQPVHRQCLHHGRGTGASICRSSMPASIRAQYAGATADLDAAVADYNGAVLNAVKQTADAMTAGDKPGRPARASSRRRWTAPRAPSPWPRNAIARACPTRFPC